MTGPGFPDERLDLPPGYTVIALRERGDAFAHATEIAATAGAGTLVWVRRFDTIEIALVLEPDQSLAEARCVIYAIMNAAADAIAAFCPPERPLVFTWPDTIMLDGGILGGIQLAAPVGCAETATPDWLVAGVMLRSVVSLRRTLADVLGRGPADAAQQFDHIQRRGTSMEAEGFEMIAAEPIINGFCRHFLAYLDQWHEHGFAPIGRTYLERMSDRHSRLNIESNGDVRALGGTGDTGMQRRSLTEALARTQWLDPETGEPWV